MKRLLSKQLPTKRFYSSPSNSVVDLTILDCETTGRKSTFHRIVEVAAVRYQNNNLIEKYSTLVCPTTRVSPDKYVNVDVFSEKYYSKDTQSVTNIAPELLATAPSSHTIFPAVRRIISDDTILVGHNLPFDAAFLIEEFLRAEISDISACFFGPYGLYNTVEEFEQEKKVTLSNERKQFLEENSASTGMICTLKLAKKIMNDFEGSFSLSTLSKVLQFPGHETGNYHRAMFDVIMTQHLWVHLVKQVTKRNGLPKTPPIKFFLELSNTKLSVQDLLPKYF